MGNKKKLCIVLFFIPLFIIGQQKVNTAHAKDSSTYAANKSNWEKAVQASDTTQIIHFSLQYAASLLNQNNAYYNPKKAKKIVETGLKVTTDTDTKNLAELHKKMGDVGRFTLNKELALEHYKKAEKHYRLLGDTYNIANCLHRTGDCLGPIEDLTVVIDYYERAIDLYKQLPDDTRVASCTANIGELQVSLGNYAKGLAYFNKALKINANGDKNQRITAYTNFEIGKLYLDSLHLKKRDTFFLKSLDVLTQLNVKDGMGYAHILLSKTYFRDQKYAQAKTEGIQGLELALKVGHKDKIREAYLILSKISEKQKNHKTSLAYYKKYSIYKDSVYNNNNQQLLADLQTKFEVDKKELALQKIEIEKNAEKDQKKLIQKQLNITFVFTAIVALLLLTITYFYWRLKKANKRLFAQKETTQQVNTELTHTLEYKDILLKEVHHRVKNNLQVISSILQLEIDTIENPQSRKSFQNSINRIYSMAMVHEQLHGNDSNQFVDSNRYFEEIIYYIESSFTNQKVQIDLRIDDIKLPLKKALPLGMILNELITNAFKYAFSAEGKEGVLQVSMEQKEGVIHITIRDNGPGIDQTKVRKNSIGLQIAKDFIYQLKGSMACSTDHGTVYTIQFSL